MPITSATQADALVAIINTVRTDAGRPPWNTKSLYSLLQKHKADKAPYRVIAQAAVTYAANPKYDTPALLFDEGDHWPPTGAHAERTKAPRCPDHEDYPAHTCGGCHADYLAGMRPAEFKGKHYDIEPTYDTAFGI